MLWTHRRNFQASPSICTSTELSGRINTPYLTVFFKVASLLHINRVCCKKTRILHGCIDLYIEDVLLEMSSVNDPRIAKQLVQSYEADSVNSAPTLPQKYLPRNKKRRFQSPNRTIHNFFVVDRIFWEEGCVCVYIYIYVCIY